jgi:hypothetical protein
MYEAMERDIGEINRELCSDIAGRGRQMVGWDMNREEDTKRGEGVGGTKSIGSKRDVVVKKLKMERRITNWWSKLGVLIGMRAEPLGSASGGERRSRTETDSCERRRWTNRNGGRAVVGERSMGRD